MKAQTTLEFLILLSAAASLSVFAIGIYSNITSAQKPLYKLLVQSPSENQTPNATARGHGSDSIYASIANITYVNRSNSLDVVITSQSRNINEVYITGNLGVAVMPSGYYNVSTSGMTVLTFSVIPENTGVITLNAVAEFTDSNGIATASAQTETYAVQSGANATMPHSPEFTASLARRNESILYGIGSGMQTYTASIWSHCSYLDWWSYGQLPLGAQCGDANWYFWLYDENCYYNHGIFYITYCVKMNPTGTTVSSIRAAQSYSYNVSLLLSNSTEHLSASLNDLKNASSLAGPDGRIYGNAAVSSVSGIGPQPYSNYMVLNTSGTMKAVNMSYYDNYIQYLNTLTSFMNYVNGTGGDPGAAAQYISYLNAETANFIAAPSASTQQCRIARHGNRSYYSCSPVSGLYYTINASINSSSNLNQSMAVQGSTVNLR